MLCVTGINVLSLTKKANNNKGLIIPQLYKLSRLSSFAPGLSPSQLRHVPRRPFTGLSLEAIRLFNIPAAEVQEIRRIEKWLNPSVTQPK